MADFAFADIYYGSCSKADTVVLELRASLTHLQSCPPMFMSNRFSEDAKRLSTTERVNLFYVVFLEFVSFCY